MCILLSLAPIINTMKHDIKQKMTQNIIYIIGTRDINGMICFLSIITFSALLLKVDCHWGFCEWSGRTDVFNKGSIFHSDPWKPHSMETLPDSASCLNNNTISCTSCLMSLMNHSSGCNSLNCFRTSGIKATNFIIMSYTNNDIKHGFPICVVHTKLYIYVHFYYYYWVAAPAGGILVPRVSSAQ